MLQSHKELVAWQKAMNLVEFVYDLTQGFPREEMFGLSSQLRRAVVSIPSNIAEGHGRKSTKEFIRHLSIAYGSLMETETQIMLAQRLDYVSEERATQILEHLDEVGRIINGLSKSLQERLHIQ